MLDVKPLDFLTGHYILTYIFRLGADTDKYRENFSRLARIKPGTSMIVEYFKVASKPLGYQVGSNIIA